MTGDTITVLSVGAADDSPLGREHGRFDVEYASDAAAALDALAAADSTVDCVLVGEHLPGMDRVEFVERVAETTSSVAVVAALGDEAPAAVVDAGATDVLPDDPSVVDDSLVATRVENVVQRRRAKATARERTARLQALLEHSSDRLSVVGEDGTYSFVSPAMERLMGHDPASMLGDSGIEYIHPDDRERVSSALADIRDDPELTRSVEYRFMDADGNYRWVESRGTNLLDDPSIQGILVNSRDITERKERESELRAEQALTEAIFAALPDVFYLFDEQMNFLRWNERLSAVSGYSDEEIETMHPGEFVAPADHEQIFGAIERVLEHGETVTVEARFETKDGEHIPYEFTGSQMTDEDGETDGLVGIGRDVSRRKERKRRFEAVFNNTYQFTGLMDPDGTLVEVNDAARQFGGLDRSEIIGEKLWEAYWFQLSDDGREVAREAVEQARGGSFYRTEIEVQGVDGTEIIDFSVRPVTDDDGTVTLLIPEGRTITDLKKREEQLNVLQRFLRHNLRNKMTVIGGNAELLESEASLSPEYAAYVDQIRAAAADLTDLTETAHEVSRLAIRQDATIQAVDVGDTLRKLAASVRDDYPSASVTVDAPAGVTVEADWRLGTVFEQLVENAIEHADHEHPNVTVTVSTGEDGVTVDVADDGPGISAAELSGIVTEEPQTQLRHGTGFGLWLVQSVVRDYGGELCYDEPPGGGSVLSVHLQRAADDQNE